MFYTEKQNLPGLLLLIDFEKAFDSVPWSFIFKVLSLYNFESLLKTGFIYFIIKLNHV